MSAPNRSGGRDVHIYDVNDPAALLGGLILTKGVTNASFYLMVDIAFIIESRYFLQDEDRVKIQRDDHPLHTGKYYIVTSGNSIV